MTNPIYLHSVNVIDGSGAPAYFAHVLIQEGLINRIDRNQAPAGIETLPINTQLINGRDLTLAPGFIDVHTHDDVLVLESAVVGQFHPKLSQGVTTVITGNCGVSVAPLTHKNPPSPLDILGSDQYRFDSFAQFLDAIVKAAPVMNVGCLVGHTTLRVKHMCDLQVPASAQESAAMAADVANAMKAGALGLSTGTYYPPARAASTQEIAALCEPLSAYDAPVTMHLRDEGNHIESAMQEAFAVGKAAGCAVVLSHHKLIGAQNAGRSAQTLALINQANQNQDVCLDCYPYDASSTMLFVERVEQSREVLITRSEAIPSAAGRLLSELAKEHGCSPAEMAAKLLPAGAIYFAMDEADVQAILKHPLTMIGSDGIAHDANPHPRLWGSFTRVLGRYSRELKLFPLEAAVHKMTGLSAQRFGLDRAVSHRPARGKILPGWAADLVLFDSAQVSDRASFTNPLQPSVGIKLVLVNGVIAAKDGVTTEAHSGRLLRNHKV